MGDRRITYDERNQSKIKSFQEFLRLHDITVPELVNMTADLTRKRLEKAIADNESVGISIGGLFLFNHNRKFRSLVWADMANNWSRVISGKRSFPFLDKSSELRENQYQKFDEGLL